MGKPLIYIVFPAKPKYTQLCNYRAKNLALDGNLQKKLDNVPKVVVILISYHEIPLFSFKDKKGDFLCLTT